VEEGLRRFSTGHPQGRELRLAVAAKRRAGRGELITIDAMV
jgi:hypothetical protein